MRLAEQVREAGFNPGDKEALGPSSPAYSQTPRRHASCVPACERRLRVSRREGPASSMQEQPAEWRPSRSDLEGFTGAKSVVTNCDSTIARLIELYTSGVSDYGQLFALWHCFLQPRGVVHSQIEAVGANLD